MSTSCCAECGEEGGASLKMCKSCMLVKYCNAECQKKHWPTHKKLCKQHAAEIRDEALFNDPPAKEDCPICFLPMPAKLISCVSLPPATISSVPIHDLAIANEGLANLATEAYFPCCGKTICDGCVHSIRKSGNYKCPFCNSDRADKTDDEMVGEFMNRAAVNDAASIYMLADYYYNGGGGLQQDHARAMELHARAAELGYSKAHWILGKHNKVGGDLKKARFHFEAAAMAGHELARNNLGLLEAQSGNMEQAVKHWTIGASAGDYIAMHLLRIWFEQGAVSRESIDSTLAAYNTSCAQFRSEARDACIQSMLETD
jgi:hypothetical protein